MNQRTMDLRFFNVDAARKNLSAQTRIAGYARLSYDEDGDGYCSIVNQQQIMRQYARDNYEDAPVTMLTDDSVSGYTFARPGFGALLDMIEAGQCNLILAKDLSRIGRHNALTQLFLEECVRCGIRVIAIDDYDSANPSDDMVLGIKTWTNERAVKDASAKVQRIVDHKQAAGTWFCAAPFGYTVLSYAQAQIEIDEAAAETVNRIYGMYDAGMGYNAICIQLTREGVPTPSRHFRDKAFAAGKTYRKKVSDEWRVSTVRAILADDFYLGVLRTNKYTRMGINGRDVRVDPSQHILFENHHPAIVEKALFERVQRRREGKKITNDRGTKKFPNIYSGIIRCGDCGAPMYAIQRKDLRSQYVCGRWFRYGKEFCSTHTVKVSVLDAIAMHYLKMIRERGKSLLKSLDEDVRRARDRSPKDPTPEQLSAAMADVLNELKAIEAQRIRQIMQNPGDEDSVNRVYDELGKDALQRKRALEARCEAAKDLRGSARESEKKLRTAMGVIDRIIESERLTKADIGAMFSAISVFADGRIAIRLTSDLLPLEMEDTGITDSPGHVPQRTYRVVAQETPLSITCAKGPLRESSAFA